MAELFDRAIPLTFDPSRHENQRENQFEAAYCEGSGKFAGKS